MAEDAETYSWSITKADSQSITIGFKFTSPELYDKDQPAMFVKVKASFSDFEPGWQDELELLSVRVPI